MTGFLEILPTGDYLIEGILGLSTVVFALFLGPDAIIFSNRFALRLESHAFQNTFVAMIIAVAAGVMTTHGIELGAAFMGDGRARN